MSYRVFVAGHRGMVGSALVRALESRGTAEVLTASRADLDLKDTAAVADFFASHPMDEVFLAAAKVGGIAANDTYPADFIYDNLLIEANVVHAAHIAGVNRLLFLGSSCIYPRSASQPMKEESLLTGVLEPTNEAYAIAKIAGIKLCESYRRQYGRDYRSLMPTNLYGPNDNFDLQGSHVLPGLLRRIHEAHRAGVAEVTIWGTGTPRREFLHVDDLADAAVHVMSLSERTYWGAVSDRLSHVNVGTGIDISISQLAEQIAAAVGYRGTFTYDASKPDGTPRKLLDVSRLEELGWRASISLEAGLQSTLDWYVRNIDSVRGT